MPTIKDVAKRAGVSISTVSHVINHTKNVSNAITIRVEQAIKDLNYKTNIFAKNLKSQNTKQIGMIVGDMCGLFFPYVMKAVSRKANANGYTVIIHDSNSDIELERSAISALVENCVDGIILSSVMPTNRKERYAEELKALLASGPRPIPLVMMERDFSAYGLDSICTDTYSGALLAMNHLISLGCRHIAHISIPIELEGRYLAYRTALEENHFPFNELYLERGDFSHIGGYECMRKILSRDLPLDGVFLGNDQMAVGALQAIQESGRRVPEDIKVIGFDNVFICDSINPPLSSINIEKEILGDKSISLLLDRIQNADTTTVCKEIVENSLVVRKSTFQK